MTEGDDAALIQAAGRAVHKAYARYSGFQVGAAVRTAAGGVFIGCNVENISYPVGVCAERNAIAAAVASEGPGMRIDRIAVVARQDGADAACAPCGACRQAIVEFGRNATVLFRSADMSFRQVSATVLLPDAFVFERKARGDDP